MKIFSYSIILFFVFVSLAQLESQWVYDTEDFINEVEISPNGSYIAAIGTSNGERVYVFNTNGSLLWKREDAFSISFSKNNYVVVGGKGIALLTGNGDLLWEYDNTSRINRVFISRYGERVIGVGEEKAYVLDRNGKLVAQFKFNGSIRLSASSCGSYIAVGTENGTLYFFENEKLIWARRVGGRIYPLSISADGNYIVFGVGSKLHVFGSNGKLLWSYSVDGSVVDIEVSENNYIAVESVEIGEILGSPTVGTTHVYFLDKNGDLLWSKILSPTSYYSFSSAISDASGVLYYFDVSMSQDGEFVITVVGNKIYLFDREGKALWESEVGEWSSGKISRDGKLIVIGSQSGKIELLFNRYAETPEKTKIVTKTVTEVLNKTETSTVTVTETKNDIKSVCGSGFIILISCGVIFLMKGNGRMKK